MSYASLEVQERWTATKKKPRAVHSRGLSSVRLTFFCPGDFGGVGDGVSRRKGLLVVGKLPNPAGAIRDGQHILEL